MARRILPILGLLTAVCAASPAEAQGEKDAEELLPLVVLQVDPTANEIQALESGSTRIRTIELGERSAIFSARGALGLSALQPGDRILVPGVAGSTSDRVRADQVQLLSADPAAPTGAGAGDRPRAPGREQTPSALGRDDRDADVLQPDPTPSPGRIGVFPSAADQPTRDPGSGGDDRGTGGRPGSETGSGTGGTGTGTGMGSGGASGGAP